MRDAAQKREADRATNDAQAGRQATLIVSRPAAPKPEADSAKKKKMGKKEPDYFSAPDPMATAKKNAEKAEKAGRRSAEKS